MFYLCQRIPGCSAPCWALNLGVFLPGKPLRCACFYNTCIEAHTRRGWDTSCLNTMLTSLYLPVYPTYSGVNVKNVGFFPLLWLGSNGSHSVLVLVLSWLESGHSFPRQGRRDLALLLHHSACPPVATWPDYSSLPLLICMDLHKTKSLPATLPPLKQLRTELTRQHGTQTH